MRADILALTKQLIAKQDNLPRLTLETGWRWGSQWQDAWTPEHGFLEGSNNGVQNLGGPAAWVAYAAISLDTDTDVHGMTTTTIEALAQQLAQLTDQQMQVLVDGTPDETAAFADPTIKQAILSILTARLDKILAM